MNRVVTGYRIDAPAVRRQNAFTKLDFLRTRLIFKLLVLGAFSVFLSLFYIWSRVQIVSSGYQINELKKVRAALLNENKLLKIELTHLSSPERIAEEVASARKGRTVLSLPDQARIIPLEGK